MIDNRDEFKECQDVSYSRSRWKDLLKLFILINFLLFLFFLKLFFYVGFTISILSVFNEWTKLLLLLTNTMNTVPYLQIVHLSNGHYAIPPISSTPTTNTHKSVATTQHSSLPTNLFVY